MSAQIVREITTDNHLPALISCFSLAYVVETDTVNNAIFVLQNSELAEQARRHDKPVYYCVRSLAVAVCFTSLFV